MGSSNRANDHWETLRPAIRSESWVSCLEDYRTVAMVSPGREQDGQALGSEQQESADDRETADDPHSTTAVNRDSEHN